VEVTTSAKAGEFVDAVLECLDLLSEFVGIVVLGGGELVFEALEAGFLALFVDFCFADVLGLGDVVDVSLSQFGDLECVVDLVAIETHDAVGVDASVFECIEDLLIVFE
jgi:hypothetical protein